MGVSIAEIARDWGVSAPTARYHVIRGCPQTSLEDARLWRDANAHKRGDSIKRTASADDQPEGPTLPARVVRRVERSGDSIGDALEMARNAHFEVNNLLNDALESGSVARIAALLSIHTKSSQALRDMEAAYREEQERRGVLIRLSEAQQLARIGFDKLLGRMKALPQKMATQAANKEALIVLSLLEREVREIISEAEKSYAL